MKKCAWCGNLIIAGGQQRDGKLYCGTSCLQLSAAPSTFCQVCLKDTTDESTGNLSRINGTGTTIMRVRSIPACAKCQSVVCRKWITFGWIPIVPLQKYRVLYRVQSRMPIGRSRFLARRLIAK